MKTIKFMILLLLLSSLTSCAHDRNLRPLLSSISDINQAINAFGPPDNVVAMPDGSSSYVWEASSTSTSGGFPVYRQVQSRHRMPVYDRHGRYAGSRRVYSYDTIVTHSPVETMYWDCKLRILADAKGTIKNSAYEGNACDSLIMNSNVVIPANQSVVINPTLTPSEPIKLAPSVEAKESLSEIINGKKAQATESKAIEDKAAASKAALEECLRQSYPKYINSKLSIEDVENELAKLCFEKAGGIDVKLTKQYSQAARLASQQNIKK